MALSRLDKVATSDANAAVIDRARAQAYLQKVYIFQQLLQSAEAAASQRLAHELLQKLVDAKPAGVDADKGRGNLAVSFDELANQVKGRAPEKGREYYVDALKLRLDLLENPQSDFYPRHVLEHFVANSYDLLGEVELRLDNVEAARDYWRQSLEIRRRNLALAIGDSEHNADYRRSLAGTLALQAQLSQRQRDWPASREALEECLTFRKALADEDPLNVTHRLSLAGTHRALGDTLLFMNDAPAAADHYRESIAIVQQLVETDGRLAFRRSLADQYYRLAAATLRASGPAAADEYFQKALQIIDTLVAAGPPSAGLKTFWMVALARCGNHEKAAELAEEVSFTEPQDRNLFQAACGFSLCIAGVAHLKNADQLTPDELARQERYAARALDALSRAVAKGYKDFTAIETDPDLDPVRGFPGFGKFLNEIKPK